MGSPSCHLSQVPEGDGSLVRTGVVNIQGGGVITARCLKVSTYNMDVDHAGLLTSDSQGITTGPGAGSGNAGAGFGGRGGRGSSGE